jgi:hypothetical protein
MRVLLTPYRRSRCLGLVFATGAVCLVFAILAVQAETATPGASTQSTPPLSGGTNAASKSPEAPKSVFVIPTSSEEGKDPFFPQSTRLRPVQRVVSSNLPPVVAELELKGVSGTANRRLAIINNRTFEAGEEGDVMCNGLRVRIKCLKIDPSSAQVFVDGKERTLYLRTKL